MKKTAFRALAVLLAAMTCVSMLALCVSAGVNGTDNTSVEIDAINTAPVMDGVITTEEWGEPVAHVVVGMARKNYGFDDNNNVLVSDYCYLNTGVLKYINPLNFDLFLRWDADNLYIGMVAQDPYGYSVAQNFTDINGKVIDRYDKYLDGGTYYDILYYDVPGALSSDTVYDSIIPHYNKDGVDTAGVIGNAGAYYEKEPGVFSSETAGMMYFWDKDGKVNYIFNFWDGDAIQFGINNSAQGVNAGGKNNPFHNTANDCGDSYIFNIDKDGVGHVVSDNRGYLGQVDGTIKWHDELYTGGSDWKKCGKSGGVDNDVPGYLVFEFAMPAQWYAATGKNVSGETIGLSVARVSGTTSGEVELKGTAKDFPRGVNATGDFPFVEGSTTLLQASALNERGGGYDSWVSWGDGVMGSQADQVPAYRSGANAVTFAGEPAGPSEPDVLRGDVNGDGVLTNADAIYLLRNIMLGDSYPINQGGDMNGDGTITNADAIYLLRNIMLGDSYPLAPDVK